MVVCREFKEASGIPKSSSSLWMSACCRGRSDNNTLKDVQKYVPERDPWKGIAPPGTTE